MESGASAAPDAEEFKDVALAVVLREPIHHPRKKTRWNSSVRRCRQGLIKLMIS